MDVHHDKITTLASKSSFVLKLSFTVMFFRYTEMSENNKTKKEDTIFTQVQCLTSSQQRNIKLQFKTCTDHNLNVHKSSLYWKITSLMGNLSLWIN